jgi:hypothetical protein
MPSLMRYPSESRHGGRSVEVVRHDSRLSHAFSFVARAAFREAESASRQTAEAPPTPKQWPSTAAIASTRPARRAPSVSVIRGADPKRVVASSETIVGARPGGVSQPDGRTIEPRISHTINFSACRDIGCSLWAIGSVQLVRPTGSVSSFLCRRPLRRCNWR